MDLLERVVVPPRLALIQRGGATLAYNPALNRWEAIDPVASEVLRWLRAARERMSLTAHLRDRFSLAPAETRDRLDRILRFLILRRMLYLDATPAVPEIEHGDHPLAVVYWICTQACDLRCSYCYQSAAVAHPDELSTAEGRDLIDQIVETGTAAIVFTGGEPFSRPDLLELARHARSAGLTTNVITNGGSITPESVGEVARTFDNVTVSLDHGVAEHHDCVRGEGSWARAVQAIDLLVGEGVPVDVNSVLSHFGLHDVEQLLAFVREHGVSDHRIIPQFPMGRGRGASVRRAELTEEELIGLNDRLAAAATRHNGDRVRPEGTYGTRTVRRDHCGAGLSEVSVDPRGWVYPCKLLQYPEFRTENVRDRRLSEIVMTHPVLASVRSRVTKNLAPCRTCVIRNHCGGGCRGIHYSFTRDYARAHPLFCAYLRRAFESQAWAEAGVTPPARRDGFEYGDSPSAGAGAGAATFIPLSALRRPAGSPQEVG